jgi:hypothetical protein
MKQDREQGKRLTMRRIESEWKARATRAAAEVNAMEAPGFIKAALLSGIEAQPNHHLMQVAALPAAIFRPDGRMDKRRYRRFVTRHKKPVAILRVKHRTTDQ